MGSFAFASPLPLGFKKLVDEQTSVLSRAAEKFISKIACY